MMRQRHQTRIKQSRRKQEIIHPGRMERKMCKEIRAVRKGIQEGAVGEPPGGGSAKPEDPSVPPGDNTPGESGKPVTPGNGSSEPENPAMLPEEGGSDEPKISEEPDEDDLGKLEQTMVNEESESVDPEEDQLTQPDPSEQCEMCQ